MEKQENNKGQELPQIYITEKHAEAIKNGSPSVSFTPLETVLTIQKKVEELEDLYKSHPELSTPGKADMPTIIKLMSIFTELRSLVDLMSVIPDEVIEGIGWNPKVYKGEYLAVVKVLISSTREFIIKNLSCSCYVIPDKIPYFGQMTSSF